MANMTMSPCTSQRRPLRISDLCLVEPIHTALERSLVLRVLLTFGLRRWLGTENPPNLAWVWRISRNILSTLQDYRAFSLLPPISQQLSLSSGLIYNAIWNRFRINRAKYNKWSLKTGNDALSLYDFQKSNTQKQGGGPTRLYYESFCIFYEFLFTFY